MHVAFSASLVMTPFSRRMSYISVLCSNLVPASNGASRIGARAPLDQVATRSGETSELHRTNSLLSTPENIYSLRSNFPLCLFYHSWTTTNRVY